MTTSVDPAKFPLDVDALLRVLNYLNPGVYIKDKNRNIMLWNHQVERITSYSADEVVGKACHQNILSPTDKNGQRLCASKLCPLYRSIQTGCCQPRIHVVVYQKKDGNKVAVSVNVAPLPNDSGDIIGGIGVFQDVMESWLQMSVDMVVNTNV